MLPGTSSPAGPGPDAPRNAVTLINAAPYLLLIIAASLPHLDLLRHGWFLADDYELLYIGKRLHVGELFSVEFYRSFPWRFIRPAGLLSWKANYMLYGYEPGGYYLTNILLHIGCTLLAAAFTTRLSGSKTAGLAAGLLFALHPSHSEAVCFLSGRYDLLCAFFYLSAFLSYMDYAEGRRGGRAYLCLAVLFWVTAILSKEMALSLPIALTLYELYFNRGPGRDTKRIICGLSPFILILPVYFVLRYKVFHGMGGYADASGGSLHASVPSAQYLLQNIHSYVTTLVFGINEAYPKDFTACRTAILTACLGGLALFIFRKSRHWRPAVFLSLLIVVSVLPVAGISPVYPDLLGARYMYLPSVFFAGLAGVVLTSWEGGKGYLKPVLAVCLTALTLCYFSLIKTNNEVWVAASGISKSIPDKFHELYTDLPKDADMTFYNIPAKLLGSPIYFENPSALKRAIYFTYGCPEDANFDVKFMVLRPGERIPRPGGPDKGFKRNIVFFYDKYTERLVRVYER